MKFFMMEHTDAQLNKADELEKAALERMQNVGINMEAALKGGKKFVESLSDEQLDAYEAYSFAKSFKAFVMKYRNMRGLNNALDVAKALVQKPPEALDAEAMLLNTPGGTYYLPDGMDGWRATNPEDLLTKVTAGVPSDDGMQLWLDIQYKNGASDDIYVICNGERINYADIPKPENEG